MNRPTRVIVANKPRLMRELVLETISQEPDVEIVAEIESESDIPQAVEKLRPDFLIIALDETDKRPPICDDLLVHYPEMKILALAAERNISVFFWASFDIHERPVEASEAGILDILRRVGQSVA
jgi:DNA-binding NarL/FixJ family response regulator